MNHLHSLFTAQRLEGVEVYADLDGHRVNGVTIPSDIAMTAQKPDLVIVNRKSKEVKLVELTVPWDTTANMAAAMTRKTERYNELTTTIQCNGFKCLNIPLEIGTRGVVKKQERPHTAVPRAKGDKGEQRDQELQQAGPPWLLHPLERQIFY